MIEILDTWVGYAISGLDKVREVIIKGAEYLPWQADLSLTILLLLTSLFIGHWITSRFVTRPTQLSFLPYYLIISTSIFLNLKYL